MVHQPRNLRISCRGIKKRKSGGFGEMDLLVKVILVVGILFVIKSHFDKKLFRSRIRELIKMQWGIYTREEYSDKVWRNISYYHRQREKIHKKSGQAQSDGSRGEGDSAGISGSDGEEPVFYLDDITWNDLEMDSIYQLMNHTWTSPGEEMLYHILRTPRLSGGELERRERFLKDMAAHPEQREELEMALYDIGKTDKISVYEYLFKVKGIKPISRLPHLLAAAVLAGCGAALFWSPSAMLVLLFAVMGVNAYFYYREKGKMVQDIALFEFILGIVRQCDNLSRIPLEACREECGRLCELAGKFKKYGRFHWLVSGGNTMSGSLFDSLFDYVRILFHVDLIKIGTMIREVKKYEGELLEIYEIIGYLDSMTAVASYREMVGEYAIPEFLSGGDCTKEMFLKEIYHPLVKNPVKNTIHTRESVLLTGSNASGKSTFIKTVAIAAIFSQTIHTVLGQEYRAVHYRIYSSMALRDSIQEQESYFIVEIKSLKRIFSALSEKGAPVLCFVDEILRGTNTQERVAASTVLLQKLAESRAMCFAATHDMELTYTLEHDFENYHFQEQMGERDISFDYLLRHGRSNTRNALKLLEMVGFDGALIDRARSQIDFEKIN